MSTEWLLEIYLNHRQGLFSLALGITRSRPDAEDAVQSAFSKLITHEMPTGDPVPYVFQVVRNAARDLQRKHQTEQNATTALFQRSEGCEPGCPDQVAQRQERERLLQTAIETLPETEREAVILKAFSGLTFRQAEEVLGVPAKTIATRYRRALAHLEEKLRDRI